MSFRAHATRALTWSWIQAAIGAVFQLGVTAAMARLLDAADFGVVALATVFVRFLAYFSQMGFGVAIVQRDQVATDELRGLATLSVAIGAGFTAIGVAISWLLDPEVGAILRALSLTFLITGFAAVPYGWLRRGLHNRELAVFELIAQLVGNGGVAIALAATGHGAWSLVFGLLTQQLVIAAAAWVAADRRGAELRLGRPTPACRGYLGFGIRHSWNTFLEFLFYNLEVLAIGRWYGIERTGHYNRASSLSHLAVEQVFTSVVRVLFPVLSRLRSEPAKERQAFFTAFLLGGIFASGFCAAMFVAAPQIVEVLFGPRWAPTIPLLRVFAVVVPFRYLLNMQSAWLDAAGALRPRTVAIIACFAVKLAILAVALIAPLGLVELTAALIAPDVLWQAAYLVVMPRATSATAGGLAAAYGVFAVVAAGVAAAIAALTWQLAAWQALPMLIAQTVAGGLLVVSAMLAAVQLGVLGVRADAFASFPVIGRLIGGRAAGAR
jgi:O-antigen/teichoic acid export membrane protein